MRDVVAKGTDGLHPERADDVVSFIGHASEHYGQVVMHFRLHGLVPPASR